MWLFWKNSIFCYTPEVRFFYFDPFFAVPVRALIFACIFQVRRGVDVYMARPQHTMIGGSGFRQNTLKYLHQITQISFFYPTSRVKLTLNTMFPCITLFLYIGYIKNFLIWTPKMLTFTLRLRLCILHETMVMAYNYETPHIMHHTSTVNSAICLWTSLSIRGI